MIQVEKISDPIRFAAIRREWDELIDDSDAAIFNSWEWMYPWFRRIAPERKLSILSAWNDQGTLVGVLPLALDHRQVAGLPVRRLAWLAETQVGSDYLEGVARRGWERPVFRAFSEELHARADDWDLLDLLDLPTGALLSTSLKHAFRGSSFEIRGSERFICPFGPLDPTQPFEAFLRQTSRGANYLRRRRWLEAQKGFEIQIEARPQRLPLVLAEFFQLHRLRWQRDGGSQGIRSVEAEAFHRDATQLLAERGKIRFYTLRLQGQPLATVYGLVDRGKFLYFQSGYDPQWSKQSVGLVLVGETFRDSLASGLLEYDFLHGTESYKQDWTKQQRRTVNLRVFRRGGTGSVWNRRQQLGARARGMLKHALPAPWADAIRRLRRRWAQA